MASWLHGSVAHWLHGSLAVWMHGTLPECQNAILPIAYPIPPSGHPLQKTSKYKTVKIQTNSRNKLKMTIILNY
jgi:hypothetical protein